MALTGARVTQLDGRLADLSVPGGQTLVPAADDPLDTVRLYFDTGLVLELSGVTRCYEFGTGPVPSLCGAVLEQVDGLLDLGARRVVPYSWAATVRLHFSPPVVLETFGPVRVVLLVP